MSKLVKMLQKAHAGEVAAYYAYGGHWRSESDPNIRRQIIDIQKHELYHILDIEAMLKDLGAQPSGKRSLMFMSIGRIIGFLCRFFSRAMKARVAEAIERFGSASYDRIAAQALAEGRGRLAEKLLEMGELESEHVRYFNVQR